MPSIPAHSIPATLIPGDGIGPEVTEATLEVLDAVGAPFDWDTPAWRAWRAWRSAAIRCHRTRSRASARTRLALKGPLTTPVGGGFRSSNVRLREEFQLYANVRPARTLVPGGRFEDIDLVLVRENLEGLYVGFEHYVPVGDDPHAVAVASGVNTRAGVAAHRASSRSTTPRSTAASKVTLVHKANVLKALTGLFLEAGRDVAQALRRARRVRRAHRRRLRDAAGDEPVAVRRDRHDQPVRRHPVRRDRRAWWAAWAWRPRPTSASDAAIFEAVHGSAPGHRRQGHRQPAGAHALARAMMLDHVGAPDRAQRVRSAIDAVLREDQVRTGDLGGKGHHGAVHRRDRGAPQGRRLIRYRGGRPHA